MPPFLRNKKLETGLFAPFGTAIRGIFSGLTDKNRSDSRGERTSVRLSKTGIDG